MTKKTTRTYYLFVPRSNNFASVYADTLKDARRKRAEFGECPDGTPENKAYWQAEMNGGSIVKVIEIRETVEGPLKTS